MKGKVKIKYPKDMLGERFGRLTVVGNPFKKEGNTALWYQCICDCGKEKTLPRSRLTREETKSCGCFRISATAKRMAKYDEFGIKGDRLYSIWNAMVGRCYAKGNTSYERYGGRGISVCEEWKNDFLKFKEWAENSGYSDDLTIDRIDVNGNYEPSNCKWETPLKQSQNRRNTIIVQIGDLIFYGISDLARYYNMKESKIRYRYSKGLRGEDLIKP